jgi:excisionase family DNA binding protein
MHDEFLTLKEAAAFLKRSPGTLYNLVHKKAIRHYKPGGKSLLFKRSELQEWVEGGAVATDEEIAEWAEGLK